MPTPKAKKKEPSPNERDYHHGNLRTAVLKAAWSLVKKQGLKELTLREVARKVGVTHAAPYHHFKNRDALLAAMTVDAFEELDAALAQAKPLAAAPDEVLRALGRAYIDFARARPERVEVMFRRGDRGDVLHGAGGRAFQHLVDAVVASQAAGLAPAGDPMALTLAAWSIVHGFAMLWVEGPLDGMEFYRGRFEELRDLTVRNFNDWLRSAAAASSR